MVKQTDALGNETLSQYEDERHPKLVTSRIDPNLSVTRWGYNDQGNVSYIIDAQNNRTDFEYAEDIGPSGDQYQNLIRKVILPEVTGESERFTTEFVYDSLGRLETVIDPRGEETNYAYGDFGVVEAITNRRGKTTEFAYDETTLRLLEIKVPTGRSTGMLSTTFEYDDFDNLTKVYNGLGQFVETAYDEVGRPLEVWDPSRAKSEYRYEDGLLDEMALPPNHASGSAARTVRLSYDDACRVEAVSREIGSSSYETRVSYGYDGFSQLRKLTRLKNSAEKSFEFDYDKLGRQTSVIDPSLKESVTSYEPFCKRNAETTARGVRRRMSFDNLCRLTQVDVGDPGASSLSVVNKRESRLFDYDELGRMTQSRQGDLASQGTSRYGQARYGHLDISGTTGGLRKYDYDQLSRVTKVTFEDETWVSYEYDEESNLITMIENSSATVGSPLPRTTRYEYYDDNLLRKVRIEKFGESDRVFEYFYDGAGRPSRIVYPVATKIEVLFEDDSAGSGWDANGRLHHLRYERDGSPLRVFEFDYDDSGNRTLQIDTTPTGSVRWEYGYDWLDRLSVVKKGLNGGAVVTTSIYHYDESDNRTGWELPQDLVEYIFTYGASNQIESRVQKTSGVIDFTELFASDDDGNVISRERDDSNLVITYGWDDFNKLIAVSSAIGSTPTTDAKQESIYGVSGFRRKKKDKNDVETTEYSAGLSTAVAKSTAESISYIQGHHILGFEQGGAYYYFLTDQLSSVRDIVRGSDGIVLQSYDYTENGEKTTVNPSGPQSAKTWVGGLSVNDDTGDSGLYLMGHRHYDPSTARFLSRDPIGFDGGMNLYSYGNSPVTTVDPMGLDPSIYHAKTGIPTPVAPITQGEVELYGEVLGEILKPVGMLMNAKGIVEDFSDGVTPGDFVQFVPFGRMAKKFAKRAPIEILNGVPCNTGASPSIGPISVTPIANVRPKTGRARVHLELPDGSELDISDVRVKAGVKNYDPRANGAIEPVKWTGPTQPGSKGFKRDPNTEERNFFKRYFP